MTEGREVQRRDRSELRASDLDREKVADLLREAAGDGRLDFDELDERLAAAYGARTYGELEPLTADLPVAGRPVSAQPATAPQAAAPMRVGGRGAGSAMAIFGGATRKGGWVVPTRMQALAVFGGVELDLRDASLEARDVTIVANAFFGGVDIIVPEGVAIRTSGAGIMGGFDGPNDDGGHPDGPVIHVTGAAVFGGVSVRRKPSKTPKPPKSPEVGGGPGRPSISPG